MIANANQALKEQPLHLAYLDGIRAFLAIYVVVHHAFMHFSFPRNSFIFYLYVPFRFGHYAVDAFIVLSGFCLMLPIVQNNGILKGGAFEFFKKRAKRILPPYYLATLFSLLLIAAIIGERTNTIWDISLPATRWSIITHALLVQDVFIHTKSKICYTLWSVSVEFRIYFLFPLILIYWRKAGAFYTTILTVLFSFVLWFLFISTPLNMGPAGINPQYLGLFTLGMFSCYLVYSPKGGRLRTFFTAKTILIIAPLIIIIFGIGRLLNSQHGIIGSLAIKDLALGILFSCFLTFVATTKTAFPQNIFNWKPLAYAGTFSYSIYLIHAPLLQVIWQYGIRPFDLPPLAGLFLLAIPGTLLVIGASRLFYFVAERPFITRKKLVA